jgi:copper oxidase (laccase) domain-containing protein
MAAFTEAGHDRVLIDRWFLPPAEGRPRLRLDLVAANRDQLVAAGVRPDRIYPAGLCTPMHLDVLTSFRAEQERAGRLAGVIRARG